MTGTFVQPDFETQGGTEYKTNLDNCMAVAQRPVQSFAPHEQATPNMTVRLDAGFLWDGEDLTEVAAQSSATITAPTTNPRIDRVVVDAITGAVGVVTGTEAADPEPPAIPAGKLPVAQVALTISTTEITNDLLTDERVLVTTAPAAVGIEVNGIYANTGTNPATELGYGTWDPLGEENSGLGLLCHYEGTTTTMDRGAGLFTASPIGVAISSTQKKFGTSSLYFNGSNHRVNYLPGAFGYGVFPVIEFEIYIVSLSSSYGSIVFGNANLLEANTGNWKLNGTLVIPDTIPTGTWMHLCLVAGVGFFVNGVQKGTGVPTGSFFPGAYEGGGIGFYLGYTSSALNPMYIDELRVWDYWKYNGAFTPAAAAYMPQQRWIRTA